MASRDRPAETDDTGPRGGFCSLLSVGGQAALQSIGARPRRAVFGVSVVQYADMIAPGRVYGGPMVPLWSRARDRALERLRGQARECGANLVLGVSVRMRDIMKAGLELRAVGTAVIDRGLGDLLSSGAPAGPVLAAVGAADYAVLRSSGFVPLGMVLDARQLWLSGSVGRSLPRRLSHPREDRSLSDTLAAGRDQVRQALAAGGQRQGGHGLIGLTIQERAEVHESTPMMVFDGQATVIAQTERFRTIERRDRTTGNLLQTQRRWERPAALPGLTLTQPLDDPAWTGHVIGQSDAAPEGSRPAIDSAPPGD